MAEKQLDTVEIIWGKYTIYERVVGGSLDFFCRLNQGNQRFRLLLKSKNAVEAVPRLRICWSKSMRSNGKGFRSSADIFAIDK